MEKAYYQELGMTIIRDRGSVNVVLDRHGPGHTGVAELIPCGENTLVRCKFCGDNSDVGGEIPTMLLTRSD